jgi:hypothetical protein
MSTTLLIALLGAAIFVLTLWMITLEIRLARTFKGGQPISMEKELAERKKDAEQTEKAVRLMAREMEEFDRRLKRKIETVRTVRFNPFQGTGGNHSFASAFLDEERNGVVLSSLYSREKVSIFAKPIRSGKSEIELSEEERKVLEG